MMRRKSLFGKAEFLFSCRKCHPCPEMVMIEPSGGRFQARVSLCRLAVSRFGLTSPPAPFRVGAAPTDSYLSKKSSEIRKRYCFSVAMNSRIQAAYWPNKPPMAPIKAETITP